jgi:hypothetical protein
LLNKGFFSGAIEGTGETCRVGTPPTPPKHLPCYQTHIPDSYTRVVPEEESYTWNSLELCRTWLNSFCCVPTTTLSVSFLPTLCVDGLLPSLAEEEEEEDEEKEEERFLSGEDTLYALSFARHCPPMCFFFFLQFFLLRIITIMKSHSKQCECLRTIVHRRASSSFFSSFFFLLRVIIIMKEGATPSNVNA